MASVRHLEFEQRMQHIRCSGHSSNPSVVLCGVPQGSVLRPILFILYIADLIDLVEESGLRPHLYADDTQVSALRTTPRLYRTE